MAGEKEAADAGNNDMEDDDWLGAACEAQFGGDANVVAPTLAAPAVGPRGTQVWPQSHRAEEEYGLSAKTSDSGDGAQGFPEMRTALPAGAGLHARWEAYMDRKLEAEGDRLTKVLVEGLMERGESQRLISRLTSLTDQVRREAAYQRDVQRNLTCRIEALSLHRSEVGKIPTAVVMEMKTSDIAGGARPAPHARLRCMPFHSARLTYGYHASTSFDRGSDLIEWWSRRDVIGSETQGQG